MEKEKNEKKYAKLLKKIGSMEKENEKPFIRRSYFKKKYYESIKKKYPDGKLKTIDYFFGIYIGMMEKYLKKLALIPPLFFLHRWLISMLGFQDWLILMFVILFVYKN